jgi:hypothetical protein
MPPISKKKYTDLLALIDADIAAVQEDVERLHTARLAAEQAFEAAQTQLVGLRAAKAVISRDVVQGGGNGSPQEA